MKLPEIFLLSVLKQTFTLEFQLFCEQMEKTAVLRKRNVPGSPAIIPYGTASGLLLDQALLLLQ